MMPGDSQAKTAAMAADATVGSCQNCSVLHQSLTEYVASFLTLKQNIAATDDSIRLREQLEELQVRLLTLEKKTVDYESVQAELEEKKDALKAYGQLSEEMAKLKQEKSNTVAENKKLGDELKSLKGLTETQTVENALLRREKAFIEKDLLQTQASLKESQEQAEKADKLTEENAIMTHMKDSLENKVRLLEDSVSKQDDQITQLNKEKILLERNISDLQARLVKLERERCKEYRSVTTQTRAEPKVDKEKVRVLLQSLWECVEPEQERSSHISMLPEFGFRRILPPSPQSKLLSNPRQMFPATTETIRQSNGLRVEAQSTHTKLKPCPRVRDAWKPQLSSPHLTEKDNLKKSNQSPRKNKPLNFSPSKVSHNVSVDEIMDYFKPMPPCISPLSELDTSLESVEMENDEMSGHPELSADVPLSKQDQPSNTETSLLNHEGLQSPSPHDKEKVVNLEHGSDQNHFGHNGLCDVAELNENSDKDNSSLNNMSLQELPQPLLSNDKVSEEAFSLPAESMEPPQKGNTDNSTENMCDTVMASEKTKDNLETVSEIDIDMTPGDIPDVTAVVSDGEKVATANSGEAEAEQCVAQSKCNESMEDTSVTENQGGHVDSCQNSSDPTPSAPLCQDAEMSESTPPGSGDSMSCVLNKNLEEGMEIDTGVHCSEENDGNKVQSPREADVTASPTESTVHYRLLSPNNSPVPHYDLEPSEATSTALSLKEVDKEKIKHTLTTDRAPSLSPEKIPVDCESLEESGHSLCRVLSPSCLLPQGLAGQTDPNMEMVCNFQSDPTASLVESFSATKEQNGCLEALTPVLDQPHSGSNVEAEETPALSPGIAQTPEFIGHVLTEMGPPLPPVLTPLTSPPKAEKPINPRHAIGKLLFPSPMDISASPVTPVKANLTPSSQQLSSSSLTSPTHPNGVPSSPLQFGSATPKHALPVPGRLPTKAVNSSPSSSTSPPQENSMRILDSMYPELSARARTLSILRGNVGLGMCSSENGALPKTADSQISGFKSISSTSTAFTKTETRGEKRPASDSSPPKSSKCPKLDGASAGVSGKKGSSLSLSGRDEAASSRTLVLDHIRIAPPSIESEEPAERDLIIDCLKKIKKQCFDLLPVVQSHIYVGNLPKKPVLRDEEKEVISEICSSNSLQVDEMIVAIMNELKSEKKNVSSLNYLQALCRVYTGICRQKKFWEKARILAYSILVEDFPDSEKLVLFVVTTWPDVLSHSSLLCQAIHAVTQLRTPKGLLGCLSAFLGWEKNPPCDIDQLILRTMTELRSGSSQTFTKHIRYGEDLGAGAWEQIFTLHLLCSHKKWKWTYEHILGKELWPLMNTWVLQPRHKQEPVRDETVATVLRLVGRLSQLGHREGCVSSLVTVANIINTFGRHGQAEGVPWPIQLAALYSVYELSPCNPKQALDALAGWRGEAIQSVPPAVTSCINQIASICRQVRS